MRNLLKAATDSLKSTVDELARAAQSSIGTSKRV